ncbi:hypothetical protein [Sphingobacterium rhinopitheci]|uniref:hypothetical protein n=1 Tax=Sphingobacterium rhinopitheci TaxID=2781960 RepID=UPI001F51C42C|nr:hypothetical protein [Sphingobacterium rhinopitheci]MCI0922551.1 hypothetical protein [Sphingobacterium rhinopitheci]
MEQILTISIISYFKNVHNLDINSSNAFELLDRLLEFQKIHFEHSDNFKPFRGLNFESIEEELIQNIHRLESSHALFRSNGNLITPNTKQYTVENRNKEYTSSLNDVTVANNLHKLIAGQFDKPQKSKSIVQQAKDDINASILSRKFKRRKK